MTLRDDRAALVRWVVSGGLVLAAHVLALAMLDREVDEAAEGAGSPVAFIELAPVAAAPPGPPSDLAPGPLQADSEASANDTPALPPAETKPPAPDPSPLPAPQSDAGEAPAPSPTPVETPTPTPVVTPTPPQPVVPPSEPPSDAVVPTAPPSVAEVAPNAAGPEPGRIASAISPRTLRWRQALVAQIERFKRYPKRAAGQFGVARLAFTIDRQGRLLDVRIVGGSGSPALDEDALATVKRAQPFPAPPETAPNEELSLVLPIRYAPLRP